MSRLVLPFLLLAAVTACDDNPATQPSQPIVVRSEGQDRLHQLDDLNRAIAHSMAFGPDVGLALLDAIADAAVLRGYAPVPAARGDFLFRAGRLAEARSAFTAAAALTRNARERAFLLARADACAGKR